MHLLTAPLRAQLIANAAAARETGDTADAAVAKLFHPASRYTFYVFDAEEIDAADSLSGRADLSLFGYCVSPLGPDCDEWGSVLLSELQALRVRGLGVERDLYFPGATRAQIKAGERP